MSRAALKKRALVAALILTVAAVAAVVVALTLSARVVAGVGLGMTGGMGMMSGAGTGEVTGADADETAPERAARLERLVRQDCGACHGMRLSGGLGPDIRASALKGLTPEFVRQIILDGVPGTAMPPWRPIMSEADADWIVNYLLRTEAE